MIQSDRRRRDFETPGVMRPTSARTDARKDIVLPLGRRGSAAASAAADAAVGGRRGGGRAATPSSGHAASERRGTYREHSGGAESCPFPLRIITNYYELLACKLASLPGYDLNICHSASAIFV